MSQESSESTPTLADVSAPSTSESKEGASNNPETGENSGMKDGNSPHTSQQRPRSWGELSQSYLDNVTGAVAGLGTAMQSTYQTVKEVGKVSQKIMLLSLFISLSLLVSHVLWASSTNNRFGMCA